MKKLKLNLNDLKVESHYTDSQNLKIKGTVNGNCTAQDPSCDPTKHGPTCYESCINPTWVVPCQAC